MADVNRLHHGFGRTREVFSIGGAEIDKAQSRPGIACRTPLLGSPADGALTVDPDLEGGRRTFFHGYGQLGIWLEYARVAGIRQVLA